MGVDVHMGVHQTSISGIPDKNDPRNQAVSAWLHGSEWAWLGSNQVTPACETVRLGTQKD
jgi:hypothetical protein